MMEDELQRLRAEVAGRAAPAEALHEIGAVRRDGDLERRWFRGGGRELLAGGRDGIWQWLEYSFPAGLQTWVLRWSEGQPATLWQIDRGAPRNRLNPGSDILRPARAPLPATERGQLDAVLADLPADLRRLLLRLADAPG